MKFIGFLDTFFILSLGITFVLLLVLVYHFRKRLNENESKYEKLLSIVNDIVQKLNEQQIPPSSTADPHLYLNSNLMNQETWNMNMMSNLEESINEELEDDQIEVATFTGEEGTDEEEGSDEEDDEEEDDEEEDDDDEDDEDDDDEEEEDDEEEDDDEEEEELKEIKTISITDDKVDANIDTEELDDDGPIDEKEVNLDVTPLTEFDPIKVDKTNVVDYSSMTVSDLRKIVKDKELATNVSKLKKSELLELLE